jgi:hypothetical protein
VYSKVASPASYQPIPFDMTKSWDWDFSMATAVVFGLAQPFLEQVSKQSSAGVPILIRSQSSLLSNFLSPFARDQWSWFTWLWQHSVVAPAYYLQRSPSS